MQCPSQNTVEQRKASFATKSLWIWSVLASPTFPATKTSNEFQLSLGQKRPATSVIDTTRALPRQRRREGATTSINAPNKNKKIVPETIANIREPHNFRSVALTSNLAPMASDLEQILRGTDDPSFYKKSQNLLHVVQELAVTLESTLITDGEGALSNLKTAPYVPRLFLNSLTICFFVQVSDKLCKRKRCAHMRSKWISCLSKPQKTHFQVRSGLILKRPTTTWKTPQFILRIRF